MLDQSIQNPHGISTFGTCVVRAEPDYATVDFAVFRVEEKPGQASDAVTATANKIRGFLSKSGVGDRKIRESNHVLNPWYTGSGDSRKLIGYRAEVAFNISVEDISKVDSILVGILDSGANEIFEVRYRTTRLREARAESRQGAFLAALKKAEMYAEAAGVKVGRTIHIEEVDAEQLMADLDEIDEFQTSGAINPSSIPVTAAVRVSFTIKGGKSAAATGQFVSFDP